MKIAKSYVWITVTAIFCFEILISSAMAATDLPDVTALQDLYRTLGYPPQLKGWRSDGGDPCVESWTGISCNGTAVRLINLAGLDLGGTLGRQLNLPNLWQLDLSFNHIEGEIPGSLPLNITYIDLSSNKFTINIPYSLAFMKHLRYLNLSHNSLSGPVSNLFGDLQSLKEMDLSYNSFIGDLPSSFGNLTNLTSLYLQNNNFTGSVTFLENLLLTDLNIQNNNFSGVLPKQFQRVPNLWIWGNGFQFGVSFPPWDLPQALLLRGGQPTIRHRYTELKRSDSSPRINKEGHNIVSHVPSYFATGFSGLLVIGVLGLISAIMARLGYVAFASTPYASTPSPLDRNVTVHYSLCDGENSGSFEINVNRFDTYEKFVETAALLVYGPFLGRAVAMELSAEIDLQQHAKLFPIGRYGLQMRWKREADLDFEPLSTDTDWQIVLSNANFIEVRTTGPFIQIMVLPWSPWPTWAPYAPPVYKKA